jgi:hypothetical protein
VRAIAKIPSGEVPKPKQVKGASVGLLPKNSAMKLCKKLKLATIDANRFKALAEFGDQMSVIGAVKVARGVYATGMDRTEYMFNALREMLAGKTDAERLEIIKAMDGLNSSQMNIATNLIKTVAAVPDEHEQHRHRVNPPPISVNIVNQQTTAKA